MVTRSFSRTQPIYSRSFLQRWQVTHVSVTADVPPRSMRPCRRAVSSLCESPTIGYNIDVSMVWRCGSGPVGYEAVQRVNRSRLCAARPSHHKLSSTPVIFSCLSIFDPFEDQMPTIQCMEPLNCVLARPCDSRTRIERLRGVLRRSQPFWDAANSKGGPSAANDGQHVLEMPSHASAMYGGMRVAPGSSSCVAASRFLAASSRTRMPA